jgi:TPR repeat protein
MRSRIELLEALKYYTKAMDCGSPEAIKDIAEMYNYGKGVAKDEEKALFYYTLYKERFP